MNYICIYNKTVHFSVFYFYFYQLLTYFNSLCQGNCVAKKGKKSNKKKISLEICTKQGVNLEIRSGNGSPEWLDWVTQHCKSEVDSLSPPIIMSRWETTNKTHFLTLYIPVICIGLFFQMNDSMDDSTWTGNNRFCF